MALTSGRREAARELPREALVGVLRRAGITERRAGAGSDLLSQPVLIAERKRIYDQDGTVRATFRSAASNPSVLLRRMFLGAPRVFEIADVSDQILLRVQARGPKFKTVAADGSEMGMVTTGQGWHPRHILQVDGETIGSLRGLKGRVYSVRDAHDLEVGRITHIPASLILWSVECNVIEMHKRMPGRMRALMPSASRAVSHLNDWWG